MPTKSHYGMKTGSIGVIRTLPTLTREQGSRSTNAMGHDKRGVSAYRTLALTLSRARTP